MLRSGDAPSRIGRGVLVLATVLALATGLGVAGRTGHAQPSATAGDASDTESREEARRIAERAYERYEANDHGAALALFRTAHRLYPNARLLVGIGNCLAELNRPVQAIDALEAALEHPVAPLDARLRAETVSLLEEQRRLVGLVELHVEPADALVLVDGEPIDARPRRTRSAVTFRMRVRAGVHRVEARSAGHVPVRRDVTIEGGSALTEVTLRLPRDPSSVGPTRDVRSQREDGESSTSPWPWIAVGAGAVLVATVVVLVAVSASSGTPDGNPGSLGYVVEVLRHDR